MLFGQRRSRSTVLCAAPQARAHPHKHISARKPQVSNLHIMFKSLQLPPLSFMPSALHLKVWGLGLKT